MNERFEKLAREAGIFKPEQFRQHIDALQLEKFAELIVEECASICYNSSLGDSDVHASLLLYKFNIDNCRTWK